MHDQTDNYGSLTSNSADLECNLQKIPKSQNSWNSQSKLTVAAIILVTIIGLFAAFSNSTGDVLIKSLSNTLQLKKSHKIDTSTTSSLMWTLNRDGYDPLTYFTSEASTFLYYEFLYSNKYNAVIEPHAPMVLYVEDFSSSSEEKYTITVSQSGNSDDSKVGSLATKGKKVEYKSVTFDCKPFEEFDITIKEVSSSGDTTEYTGKAICMYVRREIRDLTDDDLSATMDAMYQLWSSTDEDGQRLYGTDFHNITYLLEMHHFNAAWPDSDHFHEGNGFLAQHVKMTNIFENVLQLIDPSVTVPYWDFTIDAAEDLYPYESPIFSESMFGSMREPLGSEMDGGYTYANNSVIDFAIQDGRWAYVKSEANPDKFAGLESGYGYMRSPWNMNPSPYVSRFTGVGLMPKCSSHLDMFEYDDMMDFFIKIEVGPHAAVHGTNGGKFGCDLFDPLVESGAITGHSEKMNVCSLWIFTLKALYRKALILPKKGCSLPENTNDAFCPFTCTAGTEEDLKTSLFNKLVESAVPEDMTIDQQNKWVEFVCGGDAARVFAGDHAESASPSDPSFWPIHPTLERLFQAKMMIGGFSTSEWATDETDTKVCTRHECYENDAYGSWAECCYGHYADSQMLDFISGNVSSRWGPTNQETVEAADPTLKDYSMPYIYDSFAWDHCSDQVGGDINNKLKSLHSSSVKSEQEESTGHASKSSQSRL